MANFFDESNTCIANMPHDDEPHDWFIDLWVAASDGNASEADLDRLSRVIESDATARCQLLKMAQLHAWLEWLRRRFEPTVE